MTIFFISDLHLEEQLSDITHIFLDFIKSITTRNNTLFILGDLFEAWIGDDDLSPYNVKIIESLRQATGKGLVIHVMHGNRDFLIGKKFLRATGANLLPDEYVINLYGTPTLLMHGDTLCTLDVKYLAFRKKSRTWIYKTLAQLKSLQSRRELVAKMRAASREHTQSTPSYIMDVTQEEVVRVMQKNKVQHLIHGHTHRQAVHTFELNEKKGTRTVLGPWHKEGSVLVCEPDEEQKFIILK